MNLKLAGQIAVVVGGANGMGRKIVDQFAAEGANVALLDRDPVAVDVAQEAAAHGVATLSEQVDVTDFAALQAAATRVEEELGPVRHVVFTVGIDSGKGGFPFWNLEPSDWLRVHEVNVLGAVNTAHAFYAPMIARRQGTFLFFSSVAGQIGSQTDPPYSVSKASVLSFMQIAAKDFAAYNIRANAICPGMVDTPLQRRIHKFSTAELPEDERPTYEEWCAEKIGRLAVLGRLTSQEEIAATVAFLASEHARSITGQAINVDSGWVMHW
jgi:2-hydroxycyclohexanecarboxyl-CoA dehydrogenase